MKIFILLFLTVICVLSSQSAFAHPADVCDPNPLPAGYSSGGYGLPVEFSHGDMEFGGPFPVESSLTNAERYVISGAVSEDGMRMQPWHHQVFQLVNAIYERTGEVPPELTGDLINSITVDGHSDPANSVFTSPITGEYPRFNAQQFERGQVYIRPLTQEEKDFLASRIPELYQHWIEKEAYNPDTDSNDPITLSEVFYLRIYGESSVIYQGIKYIWIRED